MSQEAFDEISVLSAIYCEQDEFELLGESPETGLVYRIHTRIEKNNEKTPLSLIFHIPCDYPNNPPDISINSSHLSRKQCHDLRRGLLDTARSLPPEPMVHDLILWLQENFSTLIEPASCHSTDIRTMKAETWTALLHLDHMRSKAKYIKLIEKWTSELCLTGRLFIGKLILILLQGTKENIKEYIHLQKTVKVDVDSSGKRCKEKMMSVLCEIPQSEENKLMSTFEVKDVLSLDDLKKEFDLVGLTELYNEFVPSLM